MHNYLCKTQLMKNIKFIIFFIIEILLKIWNIFSCMWNCFLSNFSVTDGEILFTDEFSTWNEKGFSKTQPERLFIAQQFSSKRTDSFTPNRLC